MEFRKDEFEVIYTKGSGPGGQHRNKVETACEVRHLPTGIKARCQSSRSKSTNYETAMRMVLTKITVLEDQAKHEALNQARVSAVFDKSTGSKTIRTYNFQRHQVKNHLNGKTAELTRVLNGNLELIQ